MTGAHHSAQPYWLRRGLANFLPELAWNHNPDPFHPSSWNYRIISII
jgi:hypothetical protein